MREYINAIEDLRNVVEEEFYTYFEECEDITDFTDTYSIANIHSGDLYIEA